MNRMILTGLVGLALSAPVHACDSSGSVSALVESFARGVVQEQDVAAAFDYFREALSAAVAGRELPPPERLVQRAEAIGEEVARRGVAVGRALLDAIELGVRESVKEPTRLPPSSPVQRIRC